MGAGGTSQVAPRTDPKWLKWKSVILQATPNNEHSLYPRQASLVTFGNIHLFKNTERECALAELLLVLYSRALDSSLTFSGHVAHGGSRLDVKRARALCHHLVLLASSVNTFH